MTIERKRSCCKTRKDETETRQETKGFIKLLTPGLDLTRLFISLTAYWALERNQRF